jgi:hypothetical protein
MSRTLTSVVWISTLAAAAFGCGGGTATPGGGPGMPGMAGHAMAGMSATGAAGAGGTAGGAGMMMPGPMGHAGNGGMMKPGMMGAAGAAIIIGVPTPGSPGTSFPGGGPNGSGPLAPGCTPASAHECPTASGVCATSATSAPTGTTSGSICFYGPITTTTTTTTTSTPAATIEFLHETAGGQEYYRFRIIFDPAFVDNTYGVNAIGWGTKGHTFKDLVGSDHAELSLFDGTSTLVSMFDIDYITASAASACLYGALGVSGGEGKMLLGDAKHVLASTTSLDRDLNGCGYCKSSACGGDCTVDSPVTDAKYTPNAAAPNWDYRVVYEVWIDAAAFAAKGFGGASITFVHASPSKASSNTVSVTPKPCCPPGSRLYETPTGTSCTGCPEGSRPYETPTGTSCTDCPLGTQPVETPTGTSCTPCPEGTRPVETPTGTSCTSCPEGSQTYETPTGTSCTPVPPCPEGYTARTDGEGVTRCFPVPNEGSCPTGFHFVAGEGGGSCA